MRKMMLLAALAATVGIGCGEGPTKPSPVIVVTSPQEGDILKIGTIVTITWQCQGCEGIEADRATVYFDRGYLDIIDEHFLSGSLGWYVGYSRRSPIAQPGLYKIYVSSKAIPTSPQTGVVEAAGESGVFKIVR